MSTEFCKIMFFVESKQEILQPEIFCIIHAMFMQNFGIKIGSAGLRKIFNRGQNKTLLSLGNHFKRCFHACVDCPPPRQIYWLNVRTGPPHTNKNHFPASSPNFTSPNTCTVHYMCTAHCTCVQRIVQCVQFSIQCTQRTCSMYIAHMYNVHSAQLAHLTIIVQ